MEECPAGEVDGSGSELEDIDSKDSGEEDAHSDAGTNHSFFHIPCIDCTLCNETPAYRK